MTFLLRLGAACGVLSGLFIAVPGAIEAFTGETGPTSMVLAISPALAGPLLTALHLGQAGRAGRLGDIGYAINVLGLGLFGGAAFALNMVLYFVDDSVTEALATASRLGLLGSVLVFVAGTVLFGLAMLRAGRYPRIPMWAYLIGLPVFALAARLPDTPVTSALHVIVGGSLIWLARSVPATTSVPATAKVDA